MKTQPLYDHQQLALSMMEGKREFALFMEQGTGKTRTAIVDAFNVFDVGGIEALLVIAPNGVHLNWIDELEKFAPGPFGAAYWCSNPNAAEKADIVRIFTGDMSHTLRVFTMNVEALSSKKGAQAASKFVNTYRCMTIVDESTRIKTPGANRTKNAIIIGRDSAYTRILTGTPITQSPLDLFAQSEFLRVGLLGHKSYYTFRARYAFMKTVSLPKRKPFKKIMGYRQIDDLAEKIKAWSYRVKKVDCLDLPEKIYQTRYVQLSKEQLRTYKEMKTKLRTSFEGGKVTVTSMLTAIIRLQQITGGFIVSDDGVTAWLSDARVMSLMDAVTDVQGKVIVWARFREEITAIAKALRAEYGHASVVEYHGGIDKEGRVAAIDGIQEGTARFFVANTQSAGLGITLTRAETAIYYSQDFSLEGRLQSEDRNHRIGTRSNVVYIDLIAKGTVDEIISSSLRKKLALATLVIDSKDEILG